MKDIFQEKAEKAQYSASTLYRREGNDGGKESDTLQLHLAIILFLK